MKALSLGPFPPSRIWVREQLHPQEAGPSASVNAHSDPPQACSAALLLGDSESRHVDSTNIP